MQLAIHGVIGAKVTHRTIWTRGDGRQYQTTDLVIETAAGDDITILLFSDDLDLRVEENPDVIETTLKPGAP